MLELISSLCKGLNFGWPRYFRESTPILPLVKLCSYVPGNRCGKFKSAYTDIYSPWKVAVPEAIDYLGVSLGLAVLSHVLQTCGYGRRVVGVAWGNNGRRPYGSGMYYCVGCVELHPAATGRWNDQRRSPVISEATGRYGFFLPR